MQPRMTDAAPKPDTAEAPLLEALLHMLDARAGTRITLGELVESMGHRGFGFAFIVFGVLAAISPPGVGSLMAIPTLLFSLQLLAGFKEPWVPGRFNRRTFEADDVRSTLARARKWLRRIEVFAKPRWSMLSRGVVARLAGLVCFILACVVLLPGPGTNNPPGVAIAIFGFALAERDGILMLIAFVAAVLAFAIGLAAIVAVVYLVYGWMSGAL